MNFKRVLTPSINWIIDTKKSSTPKNTLSIRIQLRSSGENIEKNHGPQNGEWVIFCDVTENFNPYVWGRDQSGAIWTEIKTHHHKNIRIQVEAYKTSNSTKSSQKKKPNFAPHMEAIKKGLIVGLENASYIFLDVLKSKEKIELNCELSWNEKSLHRAISKAISIKIARHLVNLPPNLLNPKSFTEIIKKDFHFSKQTRLEIWDTGRCKKENMNLMLAVGKGSETTACLVRLSYRPKTKSRIKPVAFVGKGITFDTGGLDIKPSAGMRLMKKDMGGSASILALAHYVDQVQLGRPCDFYLALAENSVDAKSMRPSDIYQSRAGHWVEIDNTDAEGRLVLADAMNVALTRDEAPEVLIDVATLTGAIKVGLGAEIAGLFANDDGLAHELYAAGEAAGEPNWRMPLYQKYRAQLNSSFADFRNSADGFGGAITAALFLEKFASIEGANKEAQGQEKVAKASSKVLKQDPKSLHKNLAVKPKWAHFDVYCWNDKPHGALQTVGGSGQPVQTLIAWLES